MPYRKTLKVVLSATRQNLDRLPWLHFDWHEGDTVGVATLKAVGRKFSADKMDAAGRLVNDYLERKTGTVESACEHAGPFVFSFKEKVDILKFMRDMRKEFMAYGQCDHMKIVLKLQ